MMRSSFLSLLLLSVCSGFAAANGDSKSNATSSNNQDSGSSSNAGSDQTFTKITDDNIHYAVQEWVHRREDAKAQFGHISDWDVSNVKDMSDLFSSDRLNPAAQFNDDIASWNTHKLVNMSGIFYGNEEMDLDLSHWDVSRVKDMSRAFAETKKYTGLGLAYWNTTKLHNASMMFEDAGAFDANGVNQWRLDTLKDASRMFNGAKSFQGDHRFKWNTPSLINAEEMFAHTDSFVGDLSHLDTSSVTTMKGMFFKAYKFDSDLSKWNTGNVKDMNSMFAYATKFEGKGLGNWETSSVTTMANMLKKTPAFNQDLNDWSVGNVEDMRNLFRYATSMNHSLCWTLNDNADVSGIFFQSQGYFDSKCVTEKSFIKDSCCDPAIDKTCGCAEAYVTPESTSDNSGAKSRFLSAFGIITVATSLFLMFYAFRRWKKREIGTTTVSDFGMDDPDLKMNVTMTSSPSKSFSQDDEPYKDSPDSEDGPMEDIQVREII